MFLEGEEIRLLVPILEMSLGEAYVGELAVLRGLGELELAEAPTRWAKARSRSTPALAAVVASRPEGVVAGLPAA